ncbi:hypothetical protein E4U21_003774 [Claviceps maximensis]|nr:hypothetical protein E4U21_003774 [Claviceps maximensis]
MAPKDAGPRDGLLKMLISKKFADYEIQCEGETIHVHKVVLCSASPVFDSACSMSFKVVRCMLEYIYSGDYKERGNSQDDDGKASELHINVFALADRYIIPGLKECARVKLSAVFSRKSWDTTGFVRSVKQVYRTTPQTATELRDLVVQIAALNKARLLSPDEKPLYDALILDCPEFASDLLTKLMSGNVSGAFLYLRSQSPMTLDSDPYDDGNDYWARHDGAFVDYELECEGTKMPVHKAVICSQSQVFMAACSGPFEESKGTYHIKDFTITQVRCMIDFLYTGTYTAPKPPTAAAVATTSTSTKPTTMTSNANIKTNANTNTSKTPNEKWNTDDPVLHAIMFALGDKYLIIELKNCAKSFYHSSLYHHTTTVEAYLRSVREIYTRTTDELQHGCEIRRTAIKAGLQKFGSAMVSDEYKSLCDEVLGECPAFGSDLLTPLMRKTEDERMGRRCYNCGFSHPPEDYLTPLPRPGPKETTSYGSLKSNLLMRYD